jgi:hypothetical protein
LLLLLLRKLGRRRNSTSVTRRLAAVGVLRSSTVRSVTGVEALSSGSGGRTTRIACSTAVSVSHRVFFPSAGRTDAESGSQGGVDPFSEEEHSKADGHERRTFTTAVLFASFGGGDGEGTVTDAGCTVEEGRGSGRGGRVGRVERLRDRNSWGELEDGVEEREEGEVDDGVGAARRDVSEAGR